MTTPGLLPAIRACFERHATRPAVITPSADGAGQMSYAELWSRAEARTPLIEEYFDPGQVVPLFLARSVDCLALMLACVMTDRVFSVINNRVQATQLGHVLTQTQARALLIDGPGLIALKRADAGQAERLSKTQIIALQTESWLPMYDKQAARLQDTLSIRILSGEAPGGGSSVSSGTGDPARPAACLFTSGSTGQPKGVLIAATDLVARAVAEAHSFELNPGDRLLSILPWSFDVGLSQVLTSWMSGCPLVLLNSWMPADIVQTANRYAIAGLSAVPSIWTDLLRSGLSFEAPLLKYVTVSGGSLTPDNQAALIERLDGIRVIKTYGQTETCRSTIAFPEDIAAAPGSVGRAYYGTRIYIVDDDLNALPASEPGEVLHAGDGVMLGYLDGDSSGKLIDNPFYDPPHEPSRLAVRTGDRGYLDTDDQLHLLGRADDMVKIQGNRVYLAEVTAEAEALPEILEAVPVVLDRDDQQILILFVTLAPQHTGHDETSLRKRLTSHLPNYMLPKRIEILDRIPRTASGKPDRQTLQTIATEHHDQGGQST